MISLEIKEGDIYILDKYLNKSISFLKDEQASLIESIFSNTEKMMLAYFGIKYSLSKGWHQTDDYINDLKIVELGKIRKENLSRLRNNWVDLQSLVKCANQLNKYKEFANFKVELQNLDSAIEAAYNRCLSELKKQKINITREECQENLDKMYHIWSVNEKYPNLKSFL